MFKITHKTHQLHLQFLFISILYSILHRFFLCAVKIWSRTQAIVYHDISDWFRD